MRVFLAVTALAGLVVLSTLASPAAREVTGEPELVSADEVGSITADRDRRDALTRLADSLRAVRLGVVEQASRAVRPYVETIRELAIWAGLAVVALFMLVLLAASSD